MKNLLDLPTDLLCRITQSLEITKSIALKESCKTFHKLSKKITTKDVLRLQLLGKIIANTNHIRKKHVQIYNVGDHIPVVLLTFVPNHIVKRIENSFEKFTKIIKVEVLDNNVESIDPEKVGALDRTHGFYGCIIECLDTENYYHYHRNHLYNIDFPMSPHKSYTQILDILRPVLHYVTLQLFRRELLKNK